jgi:hypothetical protein
MPGIERRAIDILVDVLILRLRDAGLAADLASDVTVALRAGGYGIFPIADQGGVRAPELKRPRVRGHT